MRSLALALEREPDGVPARRPTPTVAPSNPMETETAPPGKLAGNAVYITRSGQQMMSVDALPPAQRAEFLAEHDPVGKLGLTDDSVFYRVTPRTRVEGSTIAGNPDSVAEISNHLAVEADALHAFASEDLQKAGSEKERAEIRSFLADRSPHIPVSMYASSLPSASLNVMFGSEARAGALDYAKEGHAIVSMTLGDLRKAGGGSVFFDTGAAKKNPRAVPLIVTLPEGQCVPVEVHSP